MPADNLVTLLAPSTAGKSWLSENLCTNHLPSQDEYTRLHDALTAWTDLEASRLVSEEGSSDNLMCISTPAFYFTSEAEEAALELRQHTLEKVHTYKRTPNKPPPRKAVLLATDGLTGMAGSLLASSTSYGKEFQVLVQFETPEFVRGQLVEHLQLVNNPELAIQADKVEEVQRLREKWGVVTGGEKAEAHTQTALDTNQQHSATVPVQAWLSSWLGRTIMFRSRVGDAAPDVQREQLVTRDMLCMLQKPSRMAETPAGRRRLLQLLDSLAQQVQPADTTTITNGSSSSSGGSPFAELAAEVRRLDEASRDLPDDDVLEWAEKLDALSYCISSLRIWVPSDWHRVAALQLMDNLGCGDTSALREALRQQAEAEATTMLAMMDRTNDAPTLEALLQSPFWESWLEAHLDPQQGVKPKLAIIWYIRERKEGILGDNRQLSIECLFHDPAGVSTAGQRSAKALHKRVGEKLQQALQHRGIRDDRTLQRLLRHIDIFSCLPLLGQTALRHEEELVAHYGQPKFDEALAATNVARWAASLLHYTVQEVFVQVEQQVAEVRQDLEEQQQELHRLRQKWQVVEKLAAMPVGDRTRVSVKHKRNNVMRDTLESYLGTGSHFYQEYRRFNPLAVGECQRLSMEVEKKLLLPGLAGDSVIDKIMVKVDRYLNPTDNPRAAAANLSKLQNYLQPEFQWRHRRLKLNPLKLAEREVKAMSAELEEQLLHGLRDKLLPELEAPLRGALASYIKAAMRDWEDQQVATALQEALPSKAFMAAGHEAFRVIFTPGRAHAISRLNKYFPLLTKAWKSDRVLKFKRPSDMYTALHTTLTSTLQRQPRGATHAQVVAEVRAALQGFFKELLTALAGAYRMALQKQMQVTLPKFRSRVYELALHAPGSSEKTRKTLVYKLFKDTTKAIAELRWAEGQDTVELEEVDAQISKLEERMSRLQHARVDHGQMARLLEMQSKVAHGLTTLEEGTDIFDAPLPELDSNSLTMKLLRAGCRLALTDILAAQAAAGAAALQQAAEGGATGTLQRNNWASDQVVTPDIRAAFEAQLHQEERMLKDVSGYNNNCGIFAVLSQVMGIDASGSSPQALQLAGHWRQWVADFLADQVAQEPGGVFAAALAAEANLGDNFSEAEQQQVVRQHIAGLRGGAFLTYVDMSALVQLLPGNLRVTVYCPLWDAASGYQSVIRDPAPEECERDVRLANIPAAWFMPELGGSQTINHWVVVAPTSCDGSEALPAGTPQQHQQQQQQQGGAAAGKGCTRGCQARVSRSTRAPAASSSGMQPPAAAPGPSPAGESQPVHTTVTALVASILRGMGSASSSNGPQASSHSTAATKRKAEGGSTSKKDGGAPPPKKRG